MNSERDERGRFVPGHPGGPGRPKKPPGNRYARYLDETVTEFEFKRLVNSTLEKARSGDCKARDWLGRWLLSKERAIPPTAAELAAAAEADDETAEQAGEGEA